MRTEYGFDTSEALLEEPQNIVVAVLPHPLHGRLVERVILWVRPNFTLKGRPYKLNWYAEGVAYYQPMSPQPAAGPRCQCPPAD